MGTQSQSQNAVTPIRSFNLTRNYRRTNCFRYTLPPWVLCIENVFVNLFIFMFFLVCVRITSEKKTIQLDVRYRKNLDKELYRGKLNLK